MAVINVLTRNFVLCCVVVKAWVMTYFLNFLGNLLVPAVSPRIYLANFYEEQIEGIYFAVRFLLLLLGFLFVTYSIIF